MSGLLVVTPQLVHCNNELKVWTKNAHWRNRYADTWTISYTIIDIGMPLPTSLTPFDVYVALSRCRGCECIYVFVCWGILTRGCLCLMRVNICELRTKGPSSWTKIRKDGGTICQGRAIRTDSLMLVLHTAPAFIWEQYPTAYEVISWCVAPESISIHDSTHSIFYTVARVIAHIPLIEFCLVQLICSNRPWRTYDPRGLNSNFADVKRWLCCLFVLSRCLGNKSSRCSCL